MSKAKQLFTKVAIQLDGAEITYEELAQKTGRSFNYIRNNSKSLAKAYGFNFVRANKRETLPRVLDSTNFKRVINTCLASNNLPCAYPNLEPYIGKDVTPQTVARLLLKYKDTAQEACETIADATILAGVLSQMSIPEPKITPSASKAISEAFYKTIRLVPEEELPVEPLNLQDNYCVLVPHPKTGELYPRDRKNYKEAEARATAISSKGSVAKALYKGNEVVLDCDSSEMVAQFEDLISQTESWVSPDRSKAHIVFKTDKWIPTRLNVRAKLDILGNATPNQMRYLKPNKHHNGLSPMMLTDEVLNRIHSSIDE